MKVPMFDEALNEPEPSTLQSLKSVVKNFLGNHRRVEYEKEMKDLLKNFSEFGVSQTALSAVTLGLFYKQLFIFKWTAGWAFSIRHLHYQWGLPRPVGCKLSCWLPLVLETRCSGRWVEKKVPEKTFHLWIAPFVNFSVYYGTIWTFCEYISTKFRIICLIQQENK